MCHNVAWLRMSRLVAAAAVIVSVEASVVSHALAAEPLNIVPTPLPVVIQGENLETEISLTGGAEPYSWSFNSNDLPRDMYFSFYGPGPSIRISGRPVVSGDFPVTVGVTDSQGAVDTETFILAVLPGQPEQTIEPFSWATYLGGRFTETCSASRSMVVDKLSNSFVVGKTESWDFPTSGGFNPLFIGGGWDSSDAFIARITPAGQLAWASIIGGSGYESSCKVALDPGGNVIVAGETTSEDFPATLGVPYDIEGGAVFVCKVAPSGRLLWSRVLGGCQVNSMTTDRDGGILVLGDCWSVNLAASREHLRGPDNQGCLLAKLSSAGELAWAHVFGGSGDDGANRVVCDNSGSILVAGQTLSPDFPTLRAFDATYGGAGPDDGGDVFGDAFVMKFSKQGRLLWSSYLGGTQDDVCLDAVCDRFGNLIVAGSTYSCDFPIKRAFDADFGPAVIDRYEGFVVKITPAGRLYFSSFLGGSGEDSVRAAAVDGSGRIYLCGMTTSYDFPASGVPGQYRGAADSFAARVTPTGKLSWVTLVGGTDSDFSRYITLSPTGGVYAVGQTLSADLPASNGFDRSFGGHGERDLMISKLKLTGEVLWTSYLGGSDNDYPLWAATDARGRLYILGHTDSVNLPASGGFQPALGGWRDAFVARIGDTR